jgi:exopolysaccharide production protein ExoQ
MATIATLIFGCGIAGLFLLERDGKSRVSFSLWIPAVWILIAASRSVSQWQATLAGNNITDTGSASEYYLEGNETDRWVLSALLIIALVVLVRRRQTLINLLRANSPILLFFAYCALSTLWSDHTDVAFKRWVKALGDLAMVLLVLTEADPLAAVRSLVAKAAFLLVPMSVLLIKYYPDLGRGYHPFTWTPYYTGVTTNKNELGFLCLICGLGCLWRCLQAIRDRKSGSILGYAAILSMVLWLFWMANSMTSLSCFLMAGALMVAVSARSINRSPALVHCLVAGIIAVSCSTLFFDLGSGLLATMGRDPTLTGRTDIWKMALGMNGNPLIGTGFESFWLPPRLDKIWSMYWWHPRQAHNGYIEVYLNLGWLGVGLLGVILVAGYRNVIAALRADSDSGRLRLAYFVAAVCYNFTESAIRMLNPVWIFFLLAAVTVPGGWNRALSEQDQVEVALEPNEVAGMEWNEAV